ncbi:MAG TPA: DNA polymerase III subunit delta' [Lachnospiraceae bacterium]|nr:DNA polymerase III subunit delta' [Lachnospiraceae bacterium]
MPSFSEIIGQEQIKEHLQRALQLNKVSHAYLINGERGAGKEYIADVFAMALQCEKGETEPCMECHSCKQAMSKNQPDIIRVTHEKPNTIGVEDIRDQVNKDVQIKPYSSKRKVYLINDCEKMTPQAQNALLKTLEEPPEYVVIILLTTNASLLLPTLLSRCTVLNMKPVEDKVVRRYLMEKLQVPDYQADICVAFARGNIGKAKSLASSEDFDKIKDEAVTVLKYIHQMEISDLIQAIKKIGEYKVDIHDYLDIITIWYRDVLLLKATNDATDLVFKEEIKYIREQANKSAYEGIETIIKAIEKTKQRLDANVNFDLALELLMLTIKEN